MNFQAAFLPAVRAGCVALALAFTATAAPVHAAAPMVKTQAPGYYRMMLGDFEVTALSDGTLPLPVDKVLNNPAAKTEKALARAFQKAPLETSFNAYLINTGEKLVLIDTGAAGLFGPTLGNLLANLKAAGYTPEQVDEIYITHMHPDHVGGLMAGESWPSRMRSCVPTSTMPTSGSRNRRWKPRPRQCRTFSRAHRLP